MKFNIQSKQLWFGKKAAKFASCQLLSKPLIYHTVQAYGINNNTYNNHNNNDTNTTTTTTTTTTIYNNGFIGNISIYQLNRDYR